MHFEGKEGRAKKLNIVQFNLYFIWENAGRWEGRKQLPVVASG